MTITSLLAILYGSGNYKPYLIVDSCTSSLKRGVMGVGVLSKSTSTATGSYLACSLRDLFTHTRACLPVGSSNYSAKAGYFSACFVQVCVLTIVMSVC